MIVAAMALVFAHGRYGPRRYVGISTKLTSKENSSIYASNTDTDSNDTIYADDLESGGFDAGDTFDMLATDSGNPDLMTFEYDSNNGASVSGVLSADEDNEVGDDCQAHKHVMFS